MVRLVHFHAIRARTINRRCVRLRDKGVRRSVDQVAADRLTHADWRTDRRPKTKPFAAIGDTHAQTDDLQTRGCVIRVHSSHSFSKPLDTFHQGSR